jgi:hypothetical protein
MLDRAEPTLRQVKPPFAAPAINRRPPRDPLIVRFVMWSLIAVYIAFMANWAWYAGMQLRDDAWTTTRTIRFQGDINNAISRWGSLVIQTSESWANDPKHCAPGSDPNVQAVAAPRPGDPNQRPLTFWDLVHGVDQVYQNMVNTESTDGDFGLDYPPLRLLTMSLWTEYTMRHVPGFQRWPGPWRLAYDAGGNPSALVTEDIAHPVLMINSYSIAASAVMSFILVCIWVNRGARPTLPTPRRGWLAHLLPKRRLVPWKPLSLLRTRGLLVFPLAAWAFFYAMVIAENPVPAPPPAIQFTARPMLQKSSNGTVTAVISANINGEGADAQWHVDWGRTAFYNHSTSDEGAGGDDVSTALRNLPPATLIHYRISASNERGMTRTDDQTLNTSDTLAPLPSSEVFGETWLSWQQWAGIGILFICMAGSLFMLPMWHRAWAAGLVAALFMWLDPSVIVDGHVWPQWDAWVLPPFFLAVLLQTLDWWFCAGVVLGVGMMFKGQTMIAGSLLLIWPLMAGRIRPLLRMGVGFIMAAGLVLSPWLVLNNQPADWSVGPLRWIAGVMLAALIAGALSFYRQPLWRRAVEIWHELKTPPDSAASPNAPAGPPVVRTHTGALDFIIFLVLLLAGMVITTVLVLGRWPSDYLSPPRLLGLALLLAILLLPWFLPRRAMGVWLAAILAASIWMSAFMFYGDWTWKTVGFEYGTRKFTRMALGIGSNGNLAQYLETRFGWDVHDPVHTFYPPDIAHALHLLKPGEKAGEGFLHDWGLDGTAVTLDIRQFLMFTYGLVVCLAGIGAATQFRRNDPRFLASLAAVWVLMANILCQMAGRYQMWGAAVSSILIAISPGLSLLHLVFSLLAAGMIGAQLLGSDPSRSPLIHDMFTRFGPDDGLIMLTIGMVFLYVAIAPGRRPPANELAAL